jgi:hypothetical protein
LTLVKLGAEALTLEQRSNFDRTKLNLAKEFVESSKYTAATDKLSSGESVSAVAEVILAAARSDCQANDEGFATLRTAIKAKFGEAVEGAQPPGFGDDRIAQAWDSLLALHLLSGDDGAERERVARLLRAQAVLDAIAQNVDGDLLAIVKRVLNAPIGLPKAPFFAPESRPWRVAAAGGRESSADTARHRDAENAAQAAARIEARRAALLDIRKLLWRAPDSDAEPKPGNTGGNADKVTAPLMGWRLRSRGILEFPQSVTPPGLADVGQDQTLSESTRRVLADLGMEVGRDSLSAIAEALRVANANDALALAPADSRTVLRPFAQGRGRVPAAPAGIAPLAGGAGQPVADAFVNMAAPQWSAAGFVPGGGTQPPTNSAGQPWLRPLGVGDLKVVRQTLLKYLPSEIAYIENVLISEERVREHRVTDTTETIQIVETDETVEREKTFEKTERYELQRETERTIQQDLSFKAGLTVSVEFGPVEVTASTDFAYSQSSTESQRAAETYARNITDRSVERIKRRVRQEQRVVRRLEVEEKNTHTFDNREGTQHVIGIYRYVDKYYLAQVLNYGKRLMFELLVPDPAAFFVWRQQQRALIEESDLAPPPDPGTIGPLSMMPDTYTYYVATYRVNDVSPPPPEFVTVGRAFHQKEDTSPIVTSHNELTVPAGYRAVRASHVYAPAYDADLSQSVGFVIFTADHSGSASNSYPLNDLTGTVPIAFGSVQTLAHILSIVVECERTAEHLRAWQQDTYQKIIQAYQQQLSEYRDRQAARAAAAALSSEYRQQTRSPAANRIIEREELKRGCLALITQNNQPLSADVVAANNGIEGWIDFSLARQMGPAVQFFEQAFDWENMTYLFFPYFWSPRSEWAARAELANGDALFEQFLRAGWSRVILPVTRQYEKAVLGFLATGNIAVGDSTVVIDDPEFLAYLHELENADDLEESPVPEGAPFEIKLPTDLIILQDDAALPDYTADLPPP